MTHFGKSWVVPSGSQGVWEPTISNITLSELAYGSGPGMWHCTTLHYTKLHYTKLHYTKLNYTTLH